MYKVFGVGRGKRAEQQSPGGANGTSTKPKQQPGEIRLQKELDELELPSQCRIEFPNSNNLMHFFITISPDEGFWKGAKYRFSFNIKPLYPHDAPKVKCETKIYHPNIDLDGNVCLNILREDWKPILSISSVVYGLLYLFLEPNPNDPLNKEAAEVLRTDRRQFGFVVQRSLRGGVVGGETFPRLV
ncbi:NEDD8-conjugating enzyme Ubc12 [Perkinsus olseni]|uniref:NEDD8-conjugating enzyme Ubc12 n=1 Tax=Perkinsus olseni TaxID=32597 RepID=A0A7J6PBE4_PEROL|nr:NEDD8-conjugating enzyme Ubc12 [Perkinsus olseni]